MRLGLFLSRHHGKLSEVVDVDGLAGSYADLASVQVYDDFFGETEQRDMLGRVRNDALDAVVLGGYSANQFEIGKQGRAFVQALKSKGINQNRIIFTNLYEHVALIHADRRDNANRKARLLVDTALTKARYCQAIKTVSVQPVRKVLVLGTNESAILAAGELLSKNYSVCIVEKTNSWRLPHPENAPFASLLSDIKKDANTQLFFNAEVTDFAGWHGDYTITLKKPEGDQKINTGEILLCIGNDREWIEQLRPQLRLDTDKKGYLVNINGKRSTGRTKDPGIWLLPPGDSVEQREVLPRHVSKVVHAVALSLDKPRIEHPVLVSEVNETVCGGCGTCVKTCAFSASSIDAGKKIALIDAKRCKGCGNCVTACPTNARDLLTFPTLYVNRAIEILSQGASPNGEPKILAFLCKNSGYMAADAAGHPSSRPAGGHYSANVMPLRIECGGNIDTVYILKALKEGFDGIAMVICKDNHCHNVVGNTDMERRIGLLRALLRSRMMDDNRMRIIHTYGHNGKRLNDELKGFSDDLKRLGRQ